MSRGTWPDEDGDQVDVVLCDYCPAHQVDVVLCDYCPAHQVDIATAATAVTGWLNSGWDIDPRPGRDRCPDCAAVEDEATTSPAGRRVDVAAGVP